jgi:hypothetical protein
MKSRPWATFSPLVTVLVTTELPQAEDDDSRGMQRSISLSSHNRKLTGHCSQNRREVS